MKKLTILILSLPLCFLSLAQDKAYDPIGSVKWAPTGLLVGNVAVQGEYSFNKKTSLTAKLGVPLGKNYHTKFLGPEINSANNSFRAVDPQGSESWTNIEANQAEQDIRNFLNQYPFIKNKVEVKVDKPNKSVNADFNGWVAGFRCGFSIGFAF